MKEGFFFSSKHRKPENDHTNIKFKLKWGKISLTVYKTLTIKWNNISILSDGKD